MLDGAKLGDIWGRDRAFAIGLAIYGVGSLTTALSPGGPGSCGRGRQRRGTARRSPQRPRRRRGRGAPRVLIRAPAAGAGRRGGSRRDRREPGADGAAVRPPPPAARRRRGSRARLPPPSPGSRARRSRPCPSPSPGITRGTTAPAAIAGYHPGAESGGRRARGRARPPTERDVRPPGPVSGVIGGDGSREPWRGPSAVTAHPRRRVRRTAAVGHPNRRPTPPRRAPRRTGCCRGPSRSRGSPADPRGGPARRSARGP